MNEVRRALIFDVMEDVRSNEMLHSMYHINNLVRADEVLFWLSKNRITGKRFLSFSEERGGVFGLMEMILGRISREKNQRIVHGRDYVDNVVDFQKIRGIK